MEPHSEFMSIIFLMQAHIAYGIAKESLIPICRQFKPSLQNSLMLLNLKHLSPPQKTTWTNKPSIYFLSLKLKFNELKKLD